MADGTEAVAALPGTRFALGCRLGSPATVTPPDTGECATSAARQPSSAGDDHVPADATATGPSPRCLLRRNQSDSIDSKIGSRFVSSALCGGSSSGGALRLRWGGHSVDARCAGVQCFVFSALLVIRSASL